MRHIQSIITATAALTLTVIPVSCAKSAGPESAGDFVELTVTADPGPTPISTRATGDNTAGENAVNSVQVFIYKDGVLESSTSQTGVLARIKVRIGDDKDIYVVTNAPDIPTASAGTPADLMNHPTTLGSNLVNNFVMTGHTTVTVYKPMSVTVPVTRMAAKIQLDHIILDTSSSLLAHETLVLKDLYLINVAGSVDLEAATAPSLWLNQRGWQGDVKMLCYEDLNSISLTSSHDVRHTFYCYPNATTHADDTDDPVWSPRETRLVLRVGTTHFGDVYYPLSIPAIERNHCYHYDYIRLKGLGSESEDHIFADEELEFSVSVTASWEEDPAEEHEVL